MPKVKPIFVVLTLLVASSTAVGLIDPLKDFWTDLTPVNVEQRATAEGLRKIGAEVSVAKGNVRAIRCRSKEFSDEHAETLKTLPHLRVLALYESGLRVRGLEAIAKLESLRKLHVAAPSVKLREYLVLSALGRNLESISIGSNDEGITDDLRAELQLSMTRINRFVAGDITDAGMKHVGKMHWLREFHCVSRYVTDKGLEELKHLRNLRQVVLAAWVPPEKPQPYTRKCIRSLRNASELESLKLSYVVLTADDLKYLASACSKLQRLDLFGSKIDDEALEHIKNLKQLQFLELWDTNVTDAGLVHLAEIPNLQRVRLPLHQVSEEGRESLKKALKERNPDASVR